MIELADGVELPLDVVTATIAVLANRGGGKSSFTHLLVERMYDMGLPVIVIDVKGDWYGIRSDAAGDGPGLPFTIFGGDHGDIEIEPGDGDALARLLVKDRIPAVIDLSHMSKGKAHSFATAFAESLYRYNRDPLHLVVEEADVLIPQRQSADTARLIGAMEDLAKRGRTRGIGMTVVSQRPQEVAKSVLDLMETVVLLRMSGPRTIKAIQEWISVNNDRSSDTAKEVISSLPTLETGTGWVWSPSFLGILTRAQFPLFRTFDSHVTPRVGEIRKVPRTRADIDLARITTDIVAARDTVSGASGRARGASPAQRQALDAANQRADDLTRRLTESENTVQSLQRRVAELESAVAADRTRQVLRSAVEALSGALDALDAAEPTKKPVVAENLEPAPGGAERTVNRPAAPVPAPRRAPASARAQGVDVPKFPTGAARMIESLARMAPLRLTQRQWAVAAHLKQKGGTWSNYVSLLRRAGLLDETSAGVTLTDKAWDLVGRNQPPLSAQELQAHYLDVLPTGAARMLEAVMNAYPAAAPRAQVATEANIEIGGGTFSNYLSLLRKNGLVETTRESIQATEILMHGASMGG
ncbi:Type IV secretory pathway, VirB4 components (plasmid) [Tsukamurella tyrosinosolvens]|uniref:Helicase HerA central domain-containing protein n=1 Tax=Tsukamurella tyrosinosolvens TaxID=57704 RepID=A0A1H4UI11_TSUTY|nr:protein of unknown function DUF87 [Tsukamurella tyrosinosolvens]VEH94241.1 Type IV secretory pathway, VirB4 components [Tsukamurella tyrosinosolvens]